MTGFKVSTDPIAQLQAKIQELERTLRDITGVGKMRIPLLAADPPTTDTSTNIWLLPDGRLRARHRNTADTAWVYREWVSTSPGSGTSASAPAPAPAAPITRVGVYAAQWSQSYRSTGAARTDDGTIRLYYGSSGDPFNGMNRSLVGFNHATIASDLSGSTVTKVQLTLLNIHSWFNSGSDIHFGVHNYTSEPATWTGGGIPRSMVSKHHFNRGQQRTIDLPLYFATDIRDGTGKGIALESPSTSRSFYGYASGVGDTVTPVLRVEYAK